MEDYDFDDGGDIEDERSIADLLLEILKNNFSDDPLFTFSDDTVKQLNEMYASLSSNECNPEAAISDTNTISMIREKN